MTPSAVVDRSRRETIMSAALECFLRNGVAGTTIDDLRMCSGASIGSIYHHFGGKEGVAAELYLQTLRDYQESFLVTLLASRVARAGVEGTVRHHLRWVAASPDRASYLFHCREPEVIKASDDAARALNAAFYQKASEWLDEHVRRGQIRTMPSSLYHALWMGPSLEFARLWLGGRRRRSDLLSAESPLARAAWHALRVA